MTDKLEEITFKDGRFVKLDGTEVLPTPLGNPGSYMQVGFGDFYSAQEVYARACQIAEEQDLVDQVNAYATTQDSIDLMSSKDSVLAIQLHKI